MELKETVWLMESEDYKNRFRAEHAQLKIRLEKLTAMLAKWDRGRLEFTPSVPRGVYDWQVAAMRKYLKVLEIRAQIENVVLTDDAYGCGCRPEEKQPAECPCKGGDLDPSSPFYGLD